MAAQPPKNPRVVSAGSIDLRTAKGGRACVDDSARHTPAPQQWVRTRIVRGVVVLEVLFLEIAIRGLAVPSDWARELDVAIQRALADGPRGVVCDLSAMDGLGDPKAMALLATAGRHVREWPAVPVAVVCPDPRARTALSAYPLGVHLIVVASKLAALSALLATPTPAVEWLRLAPHPTAPRASRDFITRTLLDWRLSRVIPAASLVVSELVTNSTTYAGTDIVLSVVWDLGALRLTVRDDSPMFRRQLHPALDLHGRGLTIVGGLSRAFGVLPTASGGKVVWAVLDAPRRSTSPGP